MLVTVLESANMVIIATNHLFLFDSAYARKAENAEESSLVDHTRITRRCPADALLSVIRASISKAAWVHTFALQLLRRSRRYKQCREHMNAD